jgi:RimJ/RimL family protein N-acetyltransferase
MITPEAQAKWAELQASDPSIRMYLIWAETTAHPVGVCGLTSIDLVNRRAEFSLYIAPEARGAGHGQAALKTLLSHGFANLGLHSIWGESFEGNPATRIFETLGFKVDGKRRDFYFREGKFINATLHSLLASEWWSNDELKKVQKPWLPGPQLPSSA